MSEHTRTSVVPPPDDSSKPLAGLREITPGVYEAPGVVSIFAIKEHREEVIACSDEVEARREESVVHEKRGDR
jgi:hypothetical protein